VLDAICLIGPVAHCRERLAAYRDAGLDLPILWPAMGVDSARGGHLRVFGNNALPAGLGRCIARQYSSLSVDSPQCARSGRSGLPS